MGSVKIGEVGPRSIIKWDLKLRTQIVQIIVSRGPDSLKSLQFQYLENGHVVTSEIIGCQNFSGTTFDVITFEDPLEFITKVEGYSNFRRGEQRIDKLSIHTNKKMYVIFEAKIPASDTAYYSSFNYNFGGANQFGGFYGTHSSSEVTSIGFYFNYLTAPPSSKSSK